MTAQIGDRFLLENSQYTVVAQSEPLEFSPVEYGIQPSSACTACWRGYWCVYRIREDGIFLENLYIHSARDVYPEINGVTPRLQPDGTPESHLGHRLYKGVNIRMNYNGKILMGDGFISKYYIHMGFQRAWAYERLLEVVFKDGIPIEKNDVSDTAAQIRKRIEDEVSRKDGETPRIPPRGGIPLFVGDSFSFDYGVKAWWL